MPTPPPMRAGPYDDPDRYELERLHSEGGEGGLWRGSITVDGWAIPVAVKVVHARHLLDLAEWRARWRRQAELLRSLDHPSLVKVRDVFEGPPPHEPGAGAAGDGVLYLVMNWVAGSPLGAWASADPRPGPARVLAAVEQVAEALDYLHGGEATGGRPVLHRDVKPDNVLIEGPSATLVDFGFARLAGGASMTFAGTPAYLAPEVLAGAAFSPASDRYALGATTYAALTGRLADSSDRPGMEAALLEIRGAADPRGLAREVLAMLDADPAARPVDARRWASVLRLLAGETDADGGPERTAAPVVGTTGSLTVLDPPARVMSEVSSVRRAGGRLPTPPPPLPPAPRIGRRARRALAAATAASLAVALAATAAVLTQDGDGGGVRAVAIGGVPADVGVDERSAWVADSGGDLVQVDARDARVIGRTPVGASPTDVATGGGAVWVASRGDGLLARVDGVSGRVTARVEGMGDPVGVAVSGGSVLVADAEGRRVVVVDAASATAVGSVPIDGRPQDVVVGEGAAWVVTTDGLLARIDVPARRVAASATIGGELFDVAPGSGSVWVVQADADRLLRVRPDTLETVATVPVGDRPSAVSIAFGSVWVAGFSDGTLTQVDAPTNEVVRVIDVCAGPNGANAGTDAVWVACRRDGRLVRVEP